MIERMRAGSGRRLGYRADRAQGSRASHRPRCVAKVARQPRERNEIQMRGRLL